MFGYSNSGDSQLTKVTQMNEKKITDRLQLLNDGRFHFHDFLRTMTPQIILWTVTLFALARIDWTSFDFDSLSRTLPLLFLLVAAIYASVTSLFIFIYRCFADFFEWRLKLIKSLCDQGITGRRRVFAICHTMCKERLIEMLEMLMAALFLPIFIAVVLSTSIHSARIMTEGVRHVC